MTAYAFPNAWEAAQRRLELLEECYDAASIRRAEALGVASGWRCLDDERPPTGRNGWPSNALTERDQAAPARTSPPQPLPDSAARL